MAQRTFLHIGTPKSGTTYLQSVLWRNAAALRAHGLLLPGDFQLHYTAAKAITGRRGIEARTRNRYKTAWNRLTKQIQAWPGDALVSHELLAPATREQASAALERLAASEIHLIVTVRALHRQLPVSWQEQIRGGHWLSYSAFLEQVHTGSGGRGTWFWSVQDVLDVLDRWGADLPPERIHIVTCPPTNEDPTLLWRRFASVLGVEDVEVDTEIQPRSRSLGVVEAELLRRIQGLRDYRFRDRQQHAWTRRLLSTRLLAQRNGDPIRLPDESQSWIEERTRGLVEGVMSRRYDVVGDLNDLAWRPQHDEARLASEVTTEEVAKAASWTISRLQEELVERQPTTPYPDVGPEDGEEGILELLEHIRAADTGDAPRAPEPKPQPRSSLRSFTHYLRR